MRFTIPIAFAPFFQKSMHVVSGLSILIQILLVLSDSLSEEVEKEVTSTLYSSYLL
jgi:hypothetical protein